MKEKGVQLALITLLSLKYFFFRTSTGGFPHLIVLNLGTSYIITRYTGAERAAQLQI